MTDSEKELRRLAKTIIESGVTPWPEDIRRLQDMLWPKDVLALLDRIEALEKKTEITIGVGGGAGNLFVHGDHESVAHLQKMLLKASGLEVGLGGRLREAERKGAEEMREILAAFVEGVSVPLPIENWQGTKRELTAHFARVLAERIRKRPLPGDAP